MAVPFGVVLLWLGYGTAYLGYARLQGSNNTFMQLFWPGKYQDVAPDQPSSQVAGTGALNPKPLPGAYGSGSTAATGTQGPGTLGSPPGTGATPAPTQNPTNPTGAV